MKTPLDCFQFNAESKSIFKIFKFGKKNLPHIYKYRQRDHSEKWSFFKKPTAIKYQYRKPTKTEHYLTSHSKHSDSMNKELIQIIIELYIT